MCRDRLEIRPLQAGQMVPQRRWAGKRLTLHIVFGPGIGGFVVMYHLHHEQQIVFSKLL